MDRECSLTVADKTLSIASLPPQLDHLAFGRDQPGPDRERTQEGQFQIERDGSLPGFQSTRAVSTGFSPSNHNSE